MIYNTYLDKVEVRLYMRSHWSENESIELEDLNQSDVHDYSYAQL